MRTLGIVTFLFLAFSVIFAALNPPSNVRVQPSSDTSAVINWHFDESDGESDGGFIVKYIDENLSGGNSDTRNWEQHTVTTDPKARQLEIQELSSDKPYSFCVVSVKDNRQSQCSSPITINRLAASRISPRRKQVSEEYVIDSRPRQNAEYEKEEESSFPWWILIPLILLPLLAILGYLFWKKRQTKTITTHRRTSYTKAHEGDALHHQEKAFVVNQQDYKEWEEKRLYIQQQRNANLELEKRNEELGLEIAKVRRARLEEEREALKLEHARFNDNLRS